MPKAETISMKYKHKEGTLRKVEGLCANSLEERNWTADQALSYRKTVYIYFYK